MAQDVVGWSELMSDMEPEIFTRATVLDLQKSDDALQRAVAPVTLQWAAGLSELAQLATRHFQLYLKDSPSFRVFVFVSTALSCIPISIFAVYCVGTALLTFTTARLFSR